MQESSTPPKNTDGVAPFRLHFSSDLRIDPWASSSKLNALARGNSHHVFMTIIFLQHVEFGRLDIGKPGAGAVN